MLKDIADELGATFVQQLAAARQGKLTQDVELLASGRIWTAEQGVRLGLVDQLSVLEELQRTEFHGLRMRRFGHHPSPKNTSGVEALVRAAVTELRRTPLE